MQRYTLQANIDSTLTRHESYEGQDYLVAPCIALVPGVLNNELVPLESVSDTYQAWNGVPIVLTHPIDDSGQSISANSPRVLEHYGMGRAWNFEIRDGKLACEVWVNIEKAQRLGGDAVEVLRRLEAHEPIEVSTGYWAYSNPVPGQYNGRPYVASQHTIRPDHIALLPNDIGACCWADGCGTPRVNQDTEAIDKRTLYSLVANAVQSVFKRNCPPTKTPTSNATTGDIKSALNGLLSDEMKAAGEYSYCYVEDIDGDYAIVDYNGKLWRRQFSSGDSGVTFTGDWEEVQRMTQFVPVSNQDKPPAETKEPDAEERQAADGAAESGADADVEAEEEKKEDEVTDKEVTQNEQSEAKTDSDSELLEDEPVTDTLQDYLAQNQLTMADIEAALSLRKATRESYVQTIVGNSSMTADELVAMPDAVLQKMATALTPDPKDPDQEEESEEDEPVQNVNFTGRGLPRAKTNTADAVPAPPSILRKTA